MTKLDERVSLEMEMDLMALFSESAPCEVDGHADMPHYHEGDGEWYLISGPCPHCGLDKATILSCDKFKKVVEACMTSGSVPCSTCKQRCRLAELNIRFERKDST